VVGARRRLSGVPALIRWLEADGSGDLQGLISKLDHLEWLGVDAVWLSPTFPSPNRDWGLDVAAYYDVNPELGSLTDLE
jgi:alpha-glucosidase